MPLSYRQVKDLYDVLHSAGATQMDLPTWAQQMQGDTGSDLYSAGLNDNFIKRASVGIDRALEYTGLPEAGSQFGRSFGDMFGMGDQGAQIGQNLPRMAVNLAPLSFGPFGVAASGALAGAETYTDTGSPAAGLLSGVTNMLLPGIAGKAEQGTLAFLRNQGLKRGLAEDLLPMLREGPNATGWLNPETPTGIEMVKQLFPKAGTFQGTAANIGGQLAAAGIMGASDVGQDLLARRDVRNPFSSEMGLNLTLGQLPFALLHLGGKALGFGPKYHGFDEKTGMPFTRPLTSDDAANSLQQSIDYTKSMVDRQAQSEALKKKGIGAIPNVDNQTPFSEEQQKQHDAIMADLSKKQADLQANPTPENLEELGKITAAKDDAIQEAASQGAPIGLASKYSPSAIPVTGKNLFRKDSTGFNVITVKSFPEGLTYQDGTPVKVGDRISFSDGKYPTGVNKDGTENFQLGVSKDGTKHFTKVVDKKEVVSNGNFSKENPELPIQQTQLDLHQHLARTRQLEDIEKELKVAQTLDDKVELLGRANDIRDQLGMDRIDLSKVISIEAIIAETKRAQAIDLKGTQDLHDSLNAEIDFQSKLRQNVGAGSEEENVLEYYDTLSKKSSGRRQQFLMEENGTSPFWKHAMVLAKDGQLTRERMVNAVENAAAKGKGLAGRKQAPTNEPTIYRVPNDPAGLQLLAETVRKVTADIANTPVAKILRNIFRSRTRDVITEAAEGVDTKLPTQAEILDAAIQEGIFDPDVIEGGVTRSDEGRRSGVFDPKTVKIAPEALEFASHFNDRQTDLGAEAGRVLDKINESFSHSPLEIGEISRAPGRIEEKQPSAGGGFVWGMQSYDPVNNKLGKHTLPKTGILNEQAFKNAAGRNGKPLQDVEIEMMKAVDKTVGGGAFKDGMVDVRKLGKVLSENPVEVHVYGQDGEANPDKEALDKLTHDWFDKLTSREKTTVNQLIGGYNEEIARQHLGTLDQEKLNEYVNLARKVESQPADTSLHATAHYNQISPFDTKKYPVVRVDVSLPGGGGDKSHIDAAIEALETKGSSANLQGQYGGKPLSYWKELSKRADLWSQDDLHENLPNTLGWAMVQFVPGDLLAKHNPGKYGELKGSQEKVMFVGEQQSQWGQERQKETKQTAEAYREFIGKKFSSYWPEGTSKGDKIKAALGDAFWNRPVEEKDLTKMAEATINIPDHPLLPFQHILVLKAAAQEAAKRGVTKMVVSDGETAMMTEGHDKTMPTNQEMTSQEVKDWQPSQEKGMDLHYDTTLSSAMKKLTGSEGEKVDLGPHKNAVDYSQYHFDSEVANNPENFYIREGKDKNILVPGSPIFKDEQGNPKRNITGRLYDLSSIQDIARRQGGLTIGDPSRIGKPQEKLSPKLIAPTNEQEPIHKILSGTGEDHAKFLLNSPDPEVQALAKDLLANFPEQLRKAQGYVAEGLGLAATWTDRDSLATHTVFHPDVMDMDRSKLDPLLLHELGHALSLNLLEKGLSPELTAKLEDIRNRGVKALPGKLKKQYTKLIAEDWLKRQQNAGDHDDWDSIAPAAEGFSEDNRQVLYGLLNHKELISQSWSTPSMKKYLRELPGKVNGLKAFVNWTKELFGFGEKHDNLLRELIETTHSLMSHGEFLTSADDYGKTYFDMQGKDPVYRAAQTKRAIDLLEGSRLGTTPGEIAGNLTKSQGRANPELNRTRGRIDQVLQNPDDINHDGIKQVLQEWGHAPTTKGVDDMVTSALDEGHDISNALESMPLPMARYIYEKAKDQKDIVRMLQAATAERNKGVTNIANPEIMRKPLFEVGKRLDRILEQETKEHESAQDLMGLSAIDPNGFLKRILGEMNVSRAPGKVEVKDDVPKDGKIPVERSWLSRFLEPMGQMALRFPEAQEIISKGFQLVANGRKLAHNSLKILGANIKSDQLDVIDKDSVKEAEKIVANPVLRTGVDSWIHLNQERNRDAVTMLDESDPEIAKLKQRYTSEQWDQIRDFVTKQGMSRQKFNSDKLAFLDSISTTRGAGIISESGLKTGENIAIADAMLKAVRAMKDPLGAEGAKAQFESIRGKLKDPNDFIALLNYTRGEAEKLDAIKETLDKNPFWAPAQRMEQFIVNGRLANGKAWKQSFSSKKEAELAIRERGVKLNEPIYDNWKGKEDEPFELPGMSPAMIERLREIEENQIKILVKAGVLDADGLEEYRKSSVISQAAREADAGTSTSGLNPPPRLLSHGAEDLPWLRNHIVGIQRESRFLSRELLRAQAKTYLKSPELRGDEQLRTDLSTHFDNILHPDPQLAQKMTRFASTWFMGFNIASTLVNATQPFLTHVSELTAITGRPLESYKRVTRALKEAIAGSYGKHAWATKEHERFMEDMAEAGERSMSMYDDEAQDHEAVATGMLRALDKQKPQTLGQKLSSAAGIYSTVGMMPFKAVERINASAALLASFDYYREQGLGYEEAKEKASTFNRGVNYSGGRGQRPVLAFAGRGSYPRGSAMLGTALQSYVLGTTGQIARYLQSGFFRPKGLTPYEVYNARKAAVQMLGTQLGAAGLLGLPFVSGAIALLDKLFPELELNKHIREGLGKFLSSDQENGSPLSDIAMTGVPSMMGWDLQSRLSMGNTLPGVSEVNGFQPENLIGPVANIVKNFVGGVQGWAQGDPGATGKFLPPAVRKLIETGQATLTDGGAIRDYQGRPLANPSVGEQLGQFAGFQPKRLSDQNAAARILRQTTEVMNQKQKEEVGQMAQEVMKGNYGTVRQAILQKIQSNKDYNPEDAVRAIAQNVEDMSLPRDLRREGDLRSAGSRSGLLSSFSNLSSSGSVSEVARLQLRQEVERKLGLVRPQTGELKVAMLMDQLKQSQPDLTRAQLRQTALQSLRRSQPNMLQMSQE